MHLTELLVTYVTLLQLHKICFNLLSAINGYVFESSPVLVFCNGEVVTWHVSSVGAHDYIQTATFYGHMFELNEWKEDYLSLYPMTGETISVYMDNKGQSMLITAFILALHFASKDLILRYFMALIFL